MSDLHCPVTLLVLRHAEARPRVGGDSTSAPDPGTGLTARGRAQAIELAGGLTGRRVAAVVTSPLTPAMETGSVVAEQLSVPTRIVPELHELDLGELAEAPLDDPRLAAVLDAWTGGDLSVRPPGGEEGHAVVDRFRLAVEELADQFRGETVLVVSHRGILAVGLPWLTGAAPWPGYPAVAHCAPFELVGDADGWRLTA
ncbi:MAG: histidine phosphatase family protein [Acidimicrobiales bacterium]